MVATADIGRVAAELLQETWRRHRVVELEGPHRVTPNEIAATFANLLGRPVRIEAVSRETWESLFKSQGVKTYTPHSNAGWLQRGLDRVRWGGSWLSKRKGRAGNRAPSAHRTREKALSVLQRPHTSQIR